jgi:hypothetical protein
MLVILDQLRVAVLKFVELFVVESVFLLEGGSQFESFLIQDEEAFGLVAELHLV